MLFSTPMLIISKINVPCMPMMVKNNAYSPFEFEMEIRNYLLNTIYLMDRTISFTK